ncbi:heat-shock protein Hsp20 [bacterium]|nr:MAG: heat-shock protein Hsp20 [bacterium]
MTKIRVFDPMRDFVSLREAMDRLMEDSFVRAPRGANGADGAFRPAADAWETDEAVVIELALPGANPEDVEITYEQDTLLVGGSVDPRDGSHPYVLAERARGPFQRRFALNTSIDVDKAEASFDRGVLTLRLPKSEAIKPRKINVRVN